MSPLQNMDGISSYRKLRRRLSLFDNFKPNSQNNIKQSEFGNETHKITINNLPCLEEPIDSNKYKQDAQDKEEKERNVSSKNITQLINMIISSDHEVNYAELYYLWQFLNNLFIIPKSGNDVGTSTSELNTSCNCFLDLNVNVNKKLGETKRYSSDSCIYNQNIIQSCNNNVNMSYINNSSKNNNPENLVTNDCSLITLSPNLPSIYIEQEPSFSPDEKSCDQISDGNSSSYTSPTPSSNKYSPKTRDSTYSIIRNSIKCKSHQEVQVQNNPDEDNCYLSETSLTNSYSSSNSDIASDQSSNLMNSSRKCLFGSAEKGRSKRIINSYSEKGKSVTKKIARKFKLHLKPNEYEPMSSSILEKTKTIRESSRPSSPMRLPDDAILVINQEPTKKINIPGKEAINNFQRTMSFRRSIRKRKPFKPENLSNVGNENSLNSGSFKGTIEGLSHSIRGRSSFRKKEKVPANRVRLPAVLDTYITVPPGLLSDDAPSCVSVRRAQSLGKATPEAPKPKRRATSLKCYRPY